MKPWVSSCVCCVAKIVSPTRSDWFTLKDAQLQLLPVQDNMPVVTASTLSPSGMQMAGKFGCGVLSIASNSTAGLAALPTQWSFAQESALKHSQTVDRKNWRVMLSFHIAEFTRRSPSSSS